MSLTTDRNDPRLKEGQQNETGQHDIYLVLSEEERAKGFIRPLRDTYVHVGRLQHYKSLHRMLAEDELRYYNNKYVAILTTLTDDAGAFVGGSYVTQEEYDAWQQGKRIGGCGTETKMGLALAETYARNPSFYGATFCCHCNKHFPVDQFVWLGTNQTVGS